MKRNKLWLVIGAVVVAGCSLREVPDVTEMCPHADHYVNANGNTEGHFADVSDPYHDVFLQMNRCPSDYPICYIGTDETYCHELCRDNELFCGKCIDPEVSDEFCGARGLCLSDDAGSENYAGKQCDEDSQRCVKGKCVCARNTDVRCGDACVDPDYDMNHCGARGLCTDSDAASENYMGMACDADRRCNKGKCGCARSSDIQCGDTCIDPENDIQHCGAKGLCTDSDAASDNYMGAVCDSSQRCVKSQCVCAREGDIICNGTCITPEVDNSYCGAKGNCTEDDSASDHYKGRSCDVKGGQRCDEGVCKCVNDWQIYCGTQCVDPNNDENYCGARGLCNDNNIESADFAGGKCGAGQCRDSLCQCPSGYHLYHNSCEEDTVDHCGDHETKCTVSGYIEAYMCDNKECKIKSCKEGKFLSADGKTCIGCQELVQDVSVGDSIYFGRYYQDDTEDKHPIEWQVLGKNEKGVLVVSKFVLAQKRYYTSIPDVGQVITWENSTLRSWLNGLGKEHNAHHDDYSSDSFVHDSFNESEFACVNEVTNENPDYTNGSTTVDGGNNTKDKIFCLSAGEMDAYLRHSSAYGTRFLNSTSVYMDRSDCYKYDCSTGHYKAAWWLRSPGSMTNRAKCIGLNNSGDTLVNDSTVGVRPALYLKR